MKYSFILYTYAVLRNCYKVDNLFVTYFSKEATLKLCV